MPRARDTLTLLSTFVPDPDPAARASLDRTIHLLRTTDTPFSRHQFVPGHLTSSAVVLDPSEAVLIVWHVRLQRWLQPGGHVEDGDTDLVDTARREVREETGIDLTGVVGALVGVDVHAIPAGRGEPLHWHHDLVFGFRMGEASPAANGEAQTSWCRVEGLATRGADEALRRAAARAAAALT